MLHATTWLALAGAIVAYALHSNVQDQVTPLAAGVTAASIAIGAFGGRTWFAVLFAPVTFFLAIFALMFTAYMG
jgi:hypothetical protein